MRLVNTGPPVIVKSTPGACGRRLSKSSQVPLTVHVHVHGPGVVAGLSAGERSGMIPGVRQRPRWDIPPELAHHGVGLKA